MFSKSKYVKKPFSYALSKNKKRELDFSSSLATDINNFNKIMKKKIKHNNYVSFFLLINVSSIWELDNHNTLQQVSLSVHRAFL